MNYKPFIFIFTALIGTGLFITINGKRATKRGAKSKSYKTWIKIYSRLESFPLTTNNIHKITRELQALSVFSVRDVYVQSAKLFIKCSAILGTIIIGAAVLFDDMISVLLCAALAVSIYTTAIEKKVDKINRKVYVELRKALSSLREEYLRLGSVTEALQECEVGNELKSSFDEIYNILTTANGELKLKEFFEKVPFRPIQTLARVCYNVNNIGDEVDATGQSNFVQALSYMSEDINMELSRINYQKNKFGPIEYLTLIPIPVIKIAETFFKKIMPGTSLIYDGNMGYMIRTAIIILSAICYNIVAKINTVRSIKEDDRNRTIINMLKHDKLKHFIIDIAPKNRKRKKMGYKLKKSLSRQKVEEIYLQKVIFAATCFIMSILTMVTTIQMGKQHMLTNIQQLSLVASNEMDGMQKELIIEMDNNYIAMRMEGTAPEGNDLTMYIQGYMPELTDLELQDQVSRLNTKYNYIVNAYFKWYYIPICWFIGLIGWFVPNISLKIRAWVIKTESEDDFLQMQTLMTIIMNTDCDTLDALEQLCQVSKIHKDMMLYCYHSFPSNPELELARLESRTNLTDFKRFIGKLKLTVSDLSLREAFSDLGIERNFIMGVRDATMRATIDKKRSLCGILSLLPIGALVVGELLIPIGYLGIIEFSKALSSVRAL